MEVNVKSVKVSNQELLNVHIYVIATGDLFVVLFRIPSPPWKVNGKFICFGLARVTSA